MLKWDPDQIRSGHIHLMCNYWKFICNWYAWIKQYRNKCLYIAGDGRQGYAKDAPYDAIHVGAASDGIPDAVSKNGLFKIT